MSGSSAFSRGFRNLILFEHPEVHGSHTVEAWLVEF